MNRTRHAFIVAILLLASAPLGRAQSRTAPAAIPDLEGGWVRLDAAGSGSFAGLDATFARAQLTATAREALAADVKRAAQPRFDYARDLSKPRGPGEGYVVTDGSCTLPGGVEPNSAAFHLVQARDQVVIVRENPGLPRTIYMDGRAHPHLSRWTPTAVGHSTGRYENGALVIETVGLTTGRVTAGGWRTPATTLTERYQSPATGSASR